MAATANETAQERASRLWRVFLERRTEGAFFEWLDANRSAGEAHREAR